MRFTFTLHSGDRQGFNWLWSIPVFALCCAGLLITRYKKDADAGMDWVNHTYEVMHTLDGIVIELSEAFGDSSIDKSELKRVDALLQHFQELTKDNTEQRSDYNVLHTRIQTLYSPDQTANGLAAIQKEQAAIDQLLGKMMQQEQLLLTRRQLIQHKAREQFTVTLSCSLLAALLVMLFIFRKMKKEGQRRRNTEEQLRSSESKYRDLINNVSGVIYSIDLDGHITFASAGVTALTGYNPEEVKGRHFSFLVDPPDLSKVYDHYGNQIQEGIKETALEFCTITRSGEKKWVEQVGLLLEQDGRPRGFQCFVRDVSEKKQMQQDLEAYELRLKDNQLLLQSILDNTTSIIYVKNLEGKYMIVNRRLLEVLQKAENEVIGHTDHDLSPPEHADLYKAMDEQVLQTGASMEIEERVITGNTHIHLLLTKFPLKDNEHNILGIGGIASDITERVHFQQQLITAKTEAEDARKMQEQFLANMSHEIRTPMNGIQGMTNLLMETPLNPQQEEFAGVIRRSADSLLVIINDILDLSKIKAGKLGIEKIDFRLLDVVTNTRSLFAHRISKKNIIFDVDIDAAIPEWLQGDPHRLNQVLINLVGNAVKFTEKGRIRLTVALEDRKSEATEKTGITAQPEITEKPEITGKPETIEKNEIPEKPDMVDLVFRVEDSGIGIPQDIIPHIFESFSQAGLDISRKYGGTGLGLAICHQLMELQGGSISVTSQEGEGTVFCFRLSYGYGQTNDYVRHISPSAQDLSVLLAGKHFLVIEDNPINQQLMDFVIRKAGGKVTLADNGQEAIPYLEANHYDLIIMDLQMPVMDGYETTLYLRSKLRLQTPVMAMTANAIKGEQIRCLEAGMNDYMSKPFDFKEFYLRVAELLRNPVINDGHINTCGSTYNLSLLEEIGDEGYIQDILSTFLTTLPDQLTELQQANVEKDFDKLFFISHKLKGSTGMMQATVLTENLNKIEQLSKERADASHLVQGTVCLFEELTRQLEIEKCTRAGQIQQELSR